VLGPVNDLPLGPSESWPPQPEVVSGRRKGVRLLRWHSRKSKAKSRLATPHWQPPFFLAAHAGLATHLPGRIPTKQTIDQAVASGATLIELDVCVTKDDVLVVTHDHMAPSGRHVRDLTFAEFNEEWRSGAAMLDQVVDWVDDGAALMLDLKTEYGDSKAVAVVADWLNAHTEVRVSVCEKNPLALRQIGKASPQVPLWRTLPEVDERLGRMSKQVLQELWKQRKKNGWRDFGLAVAQAVRDVPRNRLSKVRLVPWLGIEDDLPRLVNEVGATGLTVGRFLATQKLCEAAELLGIPVIAWVVNDDAGARRALTAGVKGLTSDNLAAIREAVKSKMEPSVKPGLAA
jgi:glycerophosphoryl diester phosphodiesterase